MVCPTLTQVTFPQKLLHDDGIHSSPPKDLVISSSVFSLANYVSSCVEK